MISLLVSDFPKISVSVPSIPVAVLELLKEESEPISLILIVLHLDLKHYQRPLFSNKFKIFLTKKCYY